MPDQKTQSTKSCYSMEHHRPMRGRSPIRVSMHAGATMASMEMDLCSELRIPQGKMHDNTDDNATALALVLTIARGWICDQNLMGRAAQSGSNAMHRRPKLTRPEPARPHE